MIVDEIKKHIKEQITQSKKDLKKIKKTEDAIGYATKDSASKTYMEIFDFITAEEKKRHTLKEPIIEKIEVNGCVGMLPIFQSPHKEAVYKYIEHNEVEIYNMDGENIQRCVGTARANIKRNALYFNGKIEKYIPIKELAELYPHVFYDGEKVGIVLNTTVGESKLQIVN